jgi:hypothetical protein
MDRITKTREINESVSVYNESECVRGTTRERCLIEGLELLIVAMREICAASSSVLGKSIVSHEMLR